MTMSRKLIVLILVFVAIGVVGCSKKVQTTFVNRTSEPITLQVNGPGKGVEYLGTIPGDGQIRTEISVNRIWLPYTYTYTAKHSSGMFNGTFSLAGDSNPKIWIIIPPGKRPEEPDWRHADGPSLTGSSGPITYEP